MAGPWRALMGRARGRLRYLSASPSSPSSSFSSASLSFSSLSVANADQHQPCPAPIARFQHESHTVCARLNECIWPGLGLGLVFAQKNARQHVEALLDDAEDFLLDSSSKDGLVGLDLRSPEGFLQTFEQKKAWLIASASPVEFASGTLSLKKPCLNAGASLNDTQALLMGFLKVKAPKHAEDLSFQFSCNSVIQAPAFYGSEDFVIQADSVKRKRKKKMNKHKHRKLRRLARKSRK